MKHICILITVLLLTGCSTRPSITESKLCPSYKPAKGGLTEVQGKVLSVNDFSDMAERTDSLATFPHVHLEIELTKGELPGFPKTKVFDCHLSLEPKRKYLPGDTIILLFDEKGNLETTRAGPINNE